MSTTGRCARIACVALGFVFATSTLAAGRHAHRAPRPAAAAKQRLIQPQVPREAEDQPAEAQAFFLKKRLAPGMTEYPAAEVLAAYRKSLDLPLYSTAAGGFVSRGASTNAIQALTWTPLGPGNIGGRTRAFKFVPGAASTTIYSAGVAGGVWKSTNTGTSWTAMGDLMANMAVTALAIDPSNTQIIYAGTGEGYFNGDAVQGAGIFKSIDGGANWSQVSSTNNSNFSFVNDIALSPTTSLIIYAATQTGLWRSIDNGGSWTRLIDTTNGGQSLGSASNAGGCMKIVFRTDTDTAIASCGTFRPTAPATGIWRSANASGAAPSWTHVVGPTGSGATLAQDNMGRTSIASAASAQSTMYALIACSASGANQCGTGNAFDQGLLKVMKSIDGGASWAGTYNSTFNGGAIGDLLLTNPLVQMCQGTSGFNQGWYDNVIAVDPTNANRVFVSGVEAFRSDDGGTSWGTIAYWWINSTLPQFAHADHHGIVFHPGYNGTTETRVYDLSDGGLFVSSNAATSPRATAFANICAQFVADLMGASWSNLNNGYGVTQYYHGTVYPSGTQYFGGTQDNGTSRGTDGSPNAWARLVGGDGGWTGMDRTTSGATTVLYAETTGISILKSTDNGANFNCATNGIVNCTTGAANDAGQFINPFAVDPNTQSTLWTSGKFLWRTIDSAANWVRASASMLDSGAGACGFSETFSEEAVAPGNSNLVLAGTDCGNIFRNAAALSATSATVWTSTKPRSGYVADIAFDPNNASFVYAVYSTFGGVHVWKSTNGGASFVGIDGSGAGLLPNTPVHTIAVSPLSAHVIYVGTEIGVFVTTDDGANWARENTGFANVITDHLAFNASGATGQELYAFTHGRGVFRAAVSLPLTSSTTTLASAPDPSVFGQSVTLTATVTGASGIATGTVNFLDGATPIASNVALNAAGIATTATTTLAVGAHNLSAVYSGSLVYAGSTGNDTHTVNKASTTLSISDAPDPSSVGQNVTVTATLNVTAPGGGTPGGTITVTGLNFAGCTITLPATNCSASFSTNGAKTLDASYGGSASYNSSNAAQITHTVVVDGIFANGFE